MKLKPRKPVYGLSFQELTMKEIEEKIKTIQKFIDKHPNPSHSFKDYLAKLMVERTSRIGRNK